MRERCELGQTEDGREAGSVEVVERVGSTAMMAKNIFPDLPREIREINAVVEHVRHAHFLEHCPDEDVCPDCLHELQT